MENQKPNPFPNFGVLGSQADSLRWIDVAQIEPQYGQATSASGK